MFDYSISVVLQSENPDISVGDHLYNHNVIEFCSCYGAPNITMSNIHISGFQEYVIKHKVGQYLKIDNKEKVSWSVYVSTLGMPSVLICSISHLFSIYISPNYTGQTVTFGWQEYSAAKMVNISLSG